MTVAGERTRFLFIGEPVALSGSPRWPSAGPERMRRISEIVPPRDDPR
jgi:hypothetical protein